MNHVAAPRCHQHEQPTEQVPPPILGWSRKQYSRPATSLQWGVKPPSRSASEWSEAWTATIKENMGQTRQSQISNNETTLFVVNPGRFYLASGDITSPRLTRRAFGLNTKEFYAIVEPVQSPPPSREAMLIRRHGPTERRRGRYDERTCQSLGFGIVEVCLPPKHIRLLASWLVIFWLCDRGAWLHTRGLLYVSFLTCAPGVLCAPGVFFVSLATLQHSEKVSEAKACAENRAAAAAPGERARISLVEVARKSLRSGQSSHFASHAQPFLC